MKTKFYFILIFIVSGLYAQGTRVVGYLPAYRFSNSPQIEFQKLTHLNLCFANPDSAGNLMMSDISGVKPRHCEIIQR